VDLQISIRESGDVTILDLQGRATIGVDSDLLDVSIAIPGTSTAHIPLFAMNVPVIAAQLSAPQGFQALFGRDILADCLFIYNGPRTTFTLAY